MRKADLEDLVSRQRKEIESLRSKVETLERGIIQSKAGMDQRFTMETADALIAPMPMSLRELVNEELYKRSHPPLVLKTAVRNWPSAAVFENPPEREAISLREYQLDFFDRYNYLVHYKEIRNR